MHAGDLRTVKMRTRPILALVGLVAYAGRDQSDMPDAACICA